MEMVKTGQARDAKEFNEMNLHPNGEKMCESDLWLVEPRTAGQKKPQKYAQQIEPDNGNLPPWAATTPRLTSGSANFAFSLAMTRSQFKTISTPPPNAPIPFTAAIMGFLLMLVIVFLLPIPRRDNAPNPP
jgi:hypothetical protein